MTIIHQPSTLLDFIHKQKVKGLTIGFVPTMGALHEGHLDLVNFSSSKCDTTICSIFVNPTQFNDPADFKKYPNRLESDIKMLSAARSVVLFLPSPEDIYTNGTVNLETYDLGYLESVFEGRYRPGHFQGVCQVMARLLQIVQPHYLFMGQKDYQQCMVVKKLISLIEISTELITCPTVRENDGLAMSSRNLRLDPEQRKTATQIFQTLLFTKKNIGTTPIEELKKAGRKSLSQKGFKVDYVEIADANTLQAPEKNSPLVALIAAFLGEVRLIDNMTI